MMSTFQALKSSLSRLQSDRSGNFGMMTAIVIPVLIGTAGVAIDFSNMVLQQRQLQEASDAAALAAATALASGKAATTAQAQTIAKDFVVGQMANYLSSDDAASLKDKTTVAVKETTTSTGKSYKVDVNATYDMGLTPLMNVFGKKTVELASNSSTTSGISEERSAVSMTLVLDQSGSMLAETSTLDPNNTSCTRYDENGNQYTEKVGKKTITQFSPCYIKKIDALKTAANLLLDEIDKADPSKPAKYSRTNGIGWSDKVRISNTFSWGTSNTRSQVVNLLSAGNGTESYAPMNKAYQGLQDNITNSEASIQTAAGNTKLTKYIVFMTDGNNNSTNSDTLTRSVCADAKDPTKGNIKIYSIAFMAPPRGQQLLDDCSSGAGYYFKAESMGDLISAFQKIGQETAASKTLLTQ
ncbi:VWA domain-containing protein [Rhizobium cauense]|nr:TadE/TadG family type IV pilus assembly protein [Rhizobium cauense]MBW9116201.1 VWA domain-containing protein [Rhizobium cauense]